MRILTRADFATPNPYSSSCATGAPYATTEEDMEASALKIRAMRGNSTYSMASESTTMRVLGFRYPGKSYLLALRSAWVIMRDILCFRRSHRLSSGWTERSNFPISNCFPLKPHFS